MAAGRAVWTVETDLMSPAVPVDFLVEWPREEGCEIGVFVGEGAFGAAEDEDAFSPPLSSSLLSFLLRRIERADDLLRLWLREVGR
jgi:hypothetical protein